MGEDGGRFFLDQIITVVEYLHNKSIVHRDLKPENMLVDENLNLKVTDFGFATSKNIDALLSFRGSKRYMAPEIKEEKKYDGRKTDIFSIGVILFVLVQGIFPFREGNKDDYFYKLLINQNYNLYWIEIFSEDLSDEFKDLMTKMLHYDPTKRPTI